MRRTAAAGAARTTLRADPSPHVKAIFRNFQWWQTRPNTPVQFRNMCCSTPIVANSTPNDTSPGAHHTSPGAHHTSSISGGAQHIMCCASLAIVDRRSPEVRNTRAVPVGERLLARNRRPNDDFLKFAAAMAAAVRKVPVGELLLATNRRRPAPMAPHTHTHTRTQ